MTSADLRDVIVQPQVGLEGVELRLEIFVLAKSDGVKFFAFGHPVGESLGHDESPGAGPINFGRLFL